MLRICESNFYPFKGCLQFIMFAQPMDFFPHALDQCIRGDDSYALSEGYDPADELGTGDDVDRRLEVGVAHRCEIDVLAEPVDDDADANMIKHYRVDKMLRIKALDEPRKGQKAFEAFDMALYSKSVFGMFTGEETTVTLEAENHMVGVIIDRFGKEINLAPVSDTHFQATVNVIASPQFIGWIVALGKSIRIVAPDVLVERMREEIHRLSEQYK